MANVSESKVSREDEHEECFCGSDSQKIVDQRTGDTLCRNCGYVFSDSYIDRGPDWRAFSDEDKNKRAHAKPLSEFGSTLSVSRYDAFGNKIKSSIYNDFDRMNKWHSSDGTKRTYRAGFFEIKRICSKLEKDKEIVGAAYKLFKQYVDNGLTKGRSINAAASGAVVISCKNYDSSEKLKKVVEVSKAEMKETVKAVKIYVRNDISEFRATRPEEVLPGLLSDLELPQSYVKPAIRIIERARKLRITNGKDPNGVAGAAVYIMGLLKKNKRTQKSVAKHAHVTEATLRNRYKDMVEVLNSGFL